MYISEHVDKLQEAMSIPEPKSVMVETYGELRHQHKHGDFIEVARLVGIDTEVYVWCVDTAYWVAEVPGLLNSAVAPDTNKTDVAMFEDYSDWTKAFQAAMDYATTLIVALTKLAMG